jgi:hypothetical protein
VCKDTNINMVWGKIQMYKELKYRGKKKILNHVIKYKENFTYPNS